MKSVVCYNCGSSRNEPYAEENGFHLVKCSECGLLYVNPRPSDDEISAAHRMGQHRGTRAISVTGQFKSYQVRFYRRMLADVFGPTFNWHGKSWLDIGCGHGELLVAVGQESRGETSTRGVEPNERKQTMARSRGLDVSYFDLKNHQEKYDVISLLNVFSHLPDPPSAIRQWSDLLKPGGQLLVETGDTANLAPNEHYRPFYLPDHLSFANREIVINVLTRAGFTVSKICRYPYIRPSLGAAARETIKWFVPGKTSMWPWLVHWQRHAQTDMFVRAEYTACAAIANSVLGAAAN